jgi:predicted amidohydrolase YtcJ
MYVPANLWTGDESQPGATAIALKGNKILFIGDNDTVCLKKIFSGRRFAMLYC